LSVCVSAKKYLKTLQDVILNEKQPTESYWNISAPDTSQGSSFAVISATPYYRFLGSTPFKIARGIYGQQINYVHAKI